MGAIQEGRINAGFGKVPQEFRGVRGAKRGLWSAVLRTALEFGHFSNVRLCLPNANELVTLKKLYEMMRIPKSRSDSVTVARGFSPW